MLKLVVKVDLTNHIVEVMNVHQYVSPLSLDNILSAVSIVLNIPIFNIMSKSRLGDLPDARKIYCIIAKDYTKKSLSVIGELVNIDHATVLFAIKKARGFLDRKVEVEFINTYNSVKERLNLE